MELRCQPSGQSRLHSPARSQVLEGDVSNIWLDAIRTLDDDVSTVKNVPESMRTAAWQRKQLRTQLASWAELRHDNVLYGKQSYTGVPACEYPAGYVEPYPRFFSTLQVVCRYCPQAPWSGSSLQQGSQSEQGVSLRQGKAKGLLPETSPDSGVLGGRGPKGAECRTVNRRRAGLYRADDRPARQRALGEWGSPSIRRLVLRFALQHARRINARCRRYPLA